MVGSSSSSNHDNSIQTGIERYGFITVKRKGSPQSRPGIKKFVNENNTVETKNKFQVLTEEIVNEKEVLQDKTEKPPPIYIREKCSKGLVDLLKKLVDTRFFVVPLKRGTIDETKVQLMNVKDFRTVQDNFDKNEKYYYTFQLKSARGFEVVLKGIESNVDTAEIKEDLERQDFKTKQIFNIFNKNKIPQPMYKVELQPTTIKYKKMEDHPIFKVRAVLYRRVTIEEPLKRKQVVQCFNCQEYGHTQGYCKLQKICVVCGDLHSTKECTLDKRSVETAGKKMCRNCRGNHTANYRGCPVYSHFYNKLYPKQREEQVVKKEWIQPTPNEYDPANVSKPGSYAFITTNSTNKDKNINSVDKLINRMEKFMSTMQKNMELMMNNMTLMLQLLTQNNQNK